MNTSWQLDLHDHRRVFLLRGRNDGLRLFERVRIESAQRKVFALRGATSGRG